MGVEEAKEKCQKKKPSSYTIRHAIVELWKTIPLYLNMGGLELVDVKSGKEIRIP